MFFRPDVISDPLYVIVPLYNPQRYRSRWKLYKYFEKYVACSGAKLVTIEASLGERREVILEVVNDSHSILHVRTEDEFWIKENLINRAIQSLPPDWKYVAWIDGDIQFARPDWVGETLQQLQHFSLIQMFAHAVDLGPNYEIIRRHSGFVWCHQHPEECKAAGDYYTGKPYKHPGFAWAARRQAIDDLGCLIDWAILGGGDMFMAYALIGVLDERTMPKSLGKIGIDWLQEWQARAEKYVRRNVGYMDGTLLHYWHGKKKDRKYNDRGQILTQANFSPDKDIKKDWQGIYQLNPENIKLRDGIREYLKARNEDSIDVE